MSYDPGLIIDYAEFQKNRSKIEEQYWKLNSDVLHKKWALYAYLFLLLERGFTDYKNQPVLVCHPEMTTFNKNVRDWLTKNNIYFAVITE